MKKKLLTTVLTVGVVLSLVGCGAKETTSSESVAETTEVTTEYGTEETTVEEVVEETTVAETEAVEETVVEEPAKEKIPVDITDGASFMNQVLENIKVQKFAVLKDSSTHYDVEDPSAKRISEVEYLYNWDSNTACLIGQAGDVTYYDFTDAMVYLPNEDMSGFTKMQHEDLNYALMTIYSTMFEQWVNIDNNFAVTEVTEGGYADCYCATNEFATNDGSMIYNVKVYVDAYTLLPVCTMVTKCDPNYELVLEDGTTITGENFIVTESTMNIQFLTEEDADFATFQSATTLPADDECTLIEGETTTTE